MHSINILDYAINSAQGNIDSMLKAIKNETLNISSKEVPTLEDTIKIPYFLLQEEIALNQESIKNAIKKIVLEISDKLTPSQRLKTSLIIGTAMVDLNATDAIRNTVYEDRKQPYESKKRSIDSYAKDISKELGLNDFTLTINTACTSSVNALLEARNLINSGVVDYAIVLGIEVFSQMMSSGFSSMKLLTPTFQKPFDNTRDGLVLGEAVAAVLVGKDDSAWRLRGGYSNCNSLTITSVSPSGEEYADVMHRAMQYSEIEVADITALKAHATSTPTNDMSEINAIEKVFDNTITFTALKPYTGHTLGACGVLEMAIFMASIDDGFIPKTLNHNESVIPEYVPLQEHKECKEGIFMLNYFGFGGNNTSVIIQKELV